ncbi:MAG: hypothetical protein WB783_05860 [Arenicellales bacterium]|jgi:hypothetical protein
MTTQTTQCASEELADLEEWLQSKGLQLVEKEGADLQPGEYMKKVAEPRDETSTESPTWTVTWFPGETP